MDHIKKYMDQKNAIGWRHKRFKKASKENVSFLQLKMLAVSYGKHPTVDEGVSVKIKVPEVNREQKLILARF